MKSPTMKTTRTDSILFTLAIALSVALGGPPCARAATVLDLDLPSSVDRARHIVHGRVVDATTVWSDDRARIYTDVTVEVLDVLKGPSTGQVVVRTLGGQIDGVAQLVPGAPRVSLGEELVLLLRDLPPSQRAKGALLTPARIVGLAQGLYRVRTGADGTAMAVRDLAGIQLMAAGKTREGGLDAARLPDLLREIRELSGEVRR